MNRILDWIGYQLLIWLPYWIGCNSKTRFGSWCLVRAGRHVYGKPIHFSQEQRDA